MDLAQKTTTYGSDSKEWLGSAHGVNNGDPVTLDGTLMVAVFTDGSVPSGVTLGKVTATGRYGPYSDAATDGRQTMVGHLLNPTKVATGTNPVEAMIRHGHVVEAKLPTNHGLDAAGKTDVAGRFIYV